MKLCMHNFVEALGSHARVHSRSAASRIHGGRQKFDFLIFAAFQFFFFFFNLRRVAVKFFIATCKTRRAIFYANEFQA